MRLPGRGLAALWLVLVAASGCVPGAATSSLSRARTEAHTSAAMDLAWTIEGHAAECALTRPTTWSDARRSLLARFRPELALGYTLDADDASAPRILGMARCVVGDERSARERTVLRFSRVLVPADRAIVADALPFESRWQDEPCDSIQCGWRAIRAIAPDMLEIEGPPRPGIDTSQPDVRQVLAVELGRRPEIFEIVAVQLAATPMVVVSTLERMPRGVASARRIVASREVDAGLLLGEGSRVAALLTRLAPRIGAEFGGFRVRDDSFEEYQPIPWSLIEVAVRDLEIEQRARARHAARDRVVPLDEIDLDEIAAVRRQASARALAARVAHEEPRRARLLDERVALLERLFELDGEVTALLEAISVLVDVPDLPRAHVVAARALEVAPDEAAVRAAFANTAGRDEIESALARLRPDLPLAARRELASQTLAARTMGIPFATVESSFETRRATPSVTASRVVPVEVPREALAEMLYVLVRASDPTAAPGAFTLRVDGALRGEAPFAHTLLAMRWSSTDGPIWATVPSPAPTLDRLRTLSTALQPQLLERGVVRLSATLRDAHGLDRTVALRVELDGVRARVIGASFAASEA
ncbi:MAG: hypothetical protein K1X94_01430, partial [Sandaracinaceae bacterium]|nr:hypothetical protein [Sandaracinaceae bacterium]